jgi:hypothetical protein
LFLKLPLHNVNTKALDGFICSEYIHVYNYTYNFTLEDLTSYPLTVDPVLDDYLARERPGGPNISMEFVVLFSNVIFFEIGMKLPMKISTIEVSSWQANQATTLKCPLLVASARHTTNKCYQCWIQITSSNSATPLISTSLLALVCAYIRIVKIPFD